MPPKPKSNESTRTSSSVSKRQSGLKANPTSINFEAIKKFVTDSKKEGKPIKDENLRRPVQKDIHVHNIEREMSSSEMEAAARNKLGYAEFTSTSLSLVTRKELLSDDPSIAICTITKPLAVYPDHSVGKSISTESDTFGTLTDTRMGPFHARGKCSTCDSYGKNCPGHRGKILFSYKEGSIFKPAPQYVLFIKEIIQFLKCVCHQCGALRIPVDLLREKQVFSHSPKTRLRLIAALSEKITNCPNANSTACGKIYLGRYQVSKESNELINRVVTEGKSDKYIPVYPLDAYNILSSISNEDLAALGFSEDNRPDQTMLMVGILVPPTPARPPSNIKNKQENHDITKRYREILIEANNLAKAEIIAPIAKNLYFKSMGLASKLHDMIYDKATSSFPVQSLYTMISGKGGYFREYGVGKAVEKSARSTASPGFGLKIDEVGIPIEWASTLTPREKVAAYNIKHLQKLLEIGKITTLKRNGKNLELTPENRKGPAGIKLQIGDDVERYLQDGDVVIVNRNPTLWKQNELGMKVVLGNHRSVRIPLEITVALGADFDGDEINVHLPETLDARVEVGELMDVASSLLSETRGSALIALTFNGPLSLLLMTRPENNLGKDIFNDALVNCIINDFDGNFVSDHITRCIDVKVEPYSGRSIVSLFFPRMLNYKRKLDPQVFLSKPSAMIEIDDQPYYANGDFIPPEYSLFKDEGDILPEEGEEFLYATLEFFSTPSGDGKDVYEKKAVISRKTKWVKEIVNIGELFNEIREEERKEVTYRHLNQGDIIRKSSIRDIEPFKGRVFLGQIRVNESLFEIKNGIHVSGAITSKIVGQGADFLKFFINYYGKKRSVDLINSLSKVSNWYMRRYGFSIGHEDFYLDKESQDPKFQKTLEEIKRRKLIAEAKIVAIGPERENPVEEKKRQQEIIQNLNLAAEFGVVLLTDENFKQSPLSRAIESGAKGKVSNIGQAKISAGLQLVGGKLIPPDMDGRSNPYFVANSSRLEAQGFCTHSLGEGLIPEEMVPAAQGTREQMTVMKMGVSKSGYAQRRFATLMADLKVTSNLSLRHGAQKNSRYVQNIYAEFGMDYKKTYTFKRDDVEYPTPFPIDEIIANLDDPDFM